MPSSEVLLSISVTRGINGLCGVDRGRRGLGGETGEIACAGARKRETDSVIVGGQHERAVCVERRSDVQTRLAVDTVDEVTHRCRRGGCRREGVSLGAIAHNDRLAVGEAEGVEGRGEREPCGSARIADGRSGVRRQVDIHGGGPDGTALERDLLGAGRGGAEVGIV